MIKMIFKTAFLVAMIYVPDLLAATAPNEFVGRFRDYDKTGKGMLVCGVQSGVTGTTTTSNKITGSGSLQPISTILPASKMVDTTIRRVGYCFFVDNATGRSGSCATSDPVLVQQIDALTNDHMIDLFWDPVTSRCTQITGAVFAI